MSTEAIEVYNQIVRERAESLETQFEYQMYVGNKQMAFDILEELMAYRMIDENDDRLDPKNKIFKGKDGVQLPKNGSSYVYPYYDYRNKNRSGFMPKYLYRKLNNNKVIDVITLAHNGKRVEGKYEGNTVFESFVSKVQVSLVDTSFAVAREAKEMIQILRNNKVNIGNPKDVYDECVAGVMRIYKISFSGNVLSKYRDIGYIVAKMQNDGCMLCVLVIKYEALYNSWVSIESFIKAITDGVDYLVCGNFRIVNAINPNDGMVKQSNMLNNNGLQSKSKVG